MQTILNVLWDVSLINLDMIESNAQTRGVSVGNLFVSAIKITTGAPSATTTIGKFTPAATIQNVIDGTFYQNSGTTALPVWTLIENASTFSLPASGTDSTTTTTTSFALAFTALTSGVGQKLTGSGATMTANGIVQDILMGAATAGIGQFIGTTGVYTGTGIQQIIANAATTGILSLMSATGLTSGTVQKLTGGGANMLAGGIIQDLEMGAATVGIAQKILTSGVYTGTGIVSWSANSLTTGVLQLVSATGLTSGNVQQLIGGGANMTASGQVSFINMGAATTGQGQQITSTGVYTGLNGIWQITANSATTGTVGRINATGITSGNGLYVVGGGANMITGGNVGNFDMGAGIAGSAILAQTSGIYTGTDGVQAVVANSATTGTVSKVSATGITTGLLHQTVAAQATMTTGRYYSANDGSTEVFGIGLNGHIISTVSAVPPSIAITTNQGISAVALTAGATDTCGIITSTGTQNNTADSTFTLTFGKTYTTAPKGVIITAANASAALAAQSGIYVSSVSATAVVFGVPKSSAAGATPSWRYVIIA